MASSAAPAPLLTPAVQYWRNTRRLDHIYRDPHNGDQVRLYLHYGDTGSASSQARERFRFESQTPFEDGLRRTIDWYLCRWMV